MKFIELTEEQFAPIYNYVKESMSEHESVVAAEVKTRLSSLGVVETDEFITYLVSTIRESQDLDSFQLAFKMYTKYSRKFTDKRIGKAREVDAPLSGTTHSILRPRKSDLEALGKMRTVFKTYGSDKNLTVKKAQAKRQAFGSLEKFQKPFLMKSLDKEPQTAENSISFLNLINEEVRFTEDFQVETFLHSDVREEIIYLDSSKIVNGELDKLVDIAFPIDQPFSEALKDVRELQTLLTDPTLFKNLVERVLTPFVSKGRTTFDRGPIMTGVELLDNLVGSVPATKRITSLLRGICSFLFYRTGLVSSQFQFTDVEVVRYPELGTFKIEYLKNVLLREEIRASLKELVQVANRLDWSGLVLISDVASRFFKLTRAVGRDLDRCELLDSAFKLSLMVATDKLLAQHSKISLLNLHQTSTSVQFLTTNYDFVAALGEHSNMFSGMLLADAGLSFEESQLLNWLDRRFNAVKQYAKPISDATTYIQSRKLGGQFAYVYFEDLGSKNASFLVSKIVDYSNGGVSVSTRSREGLSNELTAAYKGMLSAIDTDFASTLESALVLTGSPDYISFSTHRNESLPALTAAGVAGIVSYELLDYTGSTGDFKLKSLGNKVYKLPVEKLKSIRNELIGDLFYTKDPHTFLSVSGFENATAVDFEKHVNSLDGLDNRDLVFSSLFNEKNFLERTFSFKLPVADKISECSVTLKDLFPYELVEYAEVLPLNINTIKNSARLDLLLQAGEFSALFAKGGAKDVIRANSFFNILSRLVAHTAVSQKMAQQIYYLAVRQWMTEAEFYTADLAGVEMTRLHNSCVGVSLLILNEIVEAFDPRLLTRLIKEAEGSALWLTQKL